MKWTQRLRLAWDIITGIRKPEQVRLKGRVLSSTPHVTGGGGRMMILGTFAQRGYGGMEIGQIVDITFTAVNDDAPQQWEMENLEEPPAPQQKREDCTKPGGK